MACFIKWSVGGGDASTQEVTVFGTLSYIIPFRKNHLKPKQIHIKTWLFENMATIELSDDLEHCPNFCMI